MGFTPLETGIILFLVIIFLVILSFAYFLKSNLFNIIRNEKNIEPLILQLPNISKNNKSNNIFLQHLEKTFNTYIDDLVYEKVITSDQKKALLGNLGYFGITFTVLNNLKVIDWKYFIEEYYYKNNPSLEVVSVSEIPS